MHHPEFLKAAAEEFGSQCIVLYIEAKEKGDGRWEVYTDGGRESTGVDAVEWAKRTIDLGVGEILLTSIDRDGTRKGYDLELTSAIASTSPIPVIAHGGAGNAAHLEEIIKKGKADAVGVSSIFHYAETDIGAVKKNLSGREINVRANYSN